MLKIKNVISGYKNFKIYIEHLEVNENEKIAILGPNGSGKTTLFKTLLKLINYEGSIKLFSKELKTIPQEELIKNCSFLLQVEYQPEIRVKTYLELSGIKLNVDLMEIEKLLNKKMNEISLGEVQRVRLTRIINSNTKLAVLDEPISHLDPYFQIKILEYIKNSNRAFLLTIHDIHLAIKYFKNFILMKDGKIYSNCLNEKLFEDVFRINFKIFV
ncbi:MAG: ABC transporter ATP-binding protein [candidate division WOR-3 bacterium]|jgi:ABC-type cobalamin/Fe3+-siderophores transport system ATPase subunit